LPVRGASRYERDVRSAVGQVVASSLWIAACGGAAASAGPTAPGPIGPGVAHRAPTPVARAEPLTGGSSDGTTCEQARDQYTEEINLQTGATADLKAEDFAAILNNGAYLGPCDVPTSSKVRICAAVQNGQAVGVTVQFDPPSQDLEICVATQVRRLAFPANAKMDIVNVTF
jgi:hypothetical protein